LSTQGQKKNRGAVPEIGNRAPVFYGLFLVGQDKLPFGKLAVRHGLQLVHRCGGKLAHILVHVGHGGTDIFKRCFPAVLGVDRNNVFFLNGKAGIHAIKPPNPFYALSVYLSAAAPPVSCIRPASSKWTVFSAAVPVSRLLPLLQGR